MIWSTNRSNDALHELVLGTRVIFAAREDTFTQRTDTDETTGATSTILVAVGAFYDVIDDTRDAAAIYKAIDTKPLVSADITLLLQFRRGLLAICIGDCDQRMTIASN